MFHRIIFLSLIVSSLSCNFNRCADCFQSFSEHRLQEYSKFRALINHWIKNKQNKFFIMLERNSVNVHSNTRHSSHYKSENRMEIILTVYEYWMSAIVLWNTAFCPRSAGMIKTVPHTTVSPQMWCINGIKGWFTRTQICWQDFAK